LRRRKGIRWGWEGEEERGGEEVRNERKEG